MGIKDNQLGYLIYCTMAVYLLAFIATISRQKKPGQYLYYTGFFIELFTSLVLFILILLIIAPLSAHFYKKPDIKKIIILLGFILLIENFNFIPYYSEVLAIVKIIQLQK